MKKAKVVRGWNYQNNELVKKAGAFGARKHDIMPVEGKSLTKGQIIETHYGYNLLAVNLPDMAAKVVAFKPNAKVEFVPVLFNPKAEESVTVPAMVLRSLNYVVAEYKGRKVQLEIDRFGGQDPTRKATLVSTK